MADTEALADLLAERDKYRTESARFFLRAREWAERSGVLEAERDRLRQLNELQAATIERQADSIQKLMEQSERRKEYADRLRADVRELVEFVRICKEREWHWLPKDLAAQARALLAKHNPLQALADNAREMGLSYEGESDEHEWMSRSPASRKKRPGGIGRSRPIYIWPAPSKPPTASAPLA